MEKWSEIRSNHQDENFCYIDAWKTDDDTEEGKVIAYIDMLSGRVLYTVPEARTSKMVQDVISEIVKEVKKQHPYSVERMENILRSVVDFECDEIGTGVDVAGNLYAMGFSKEEMIHFGFPPEEEASV